MKNAIIEKIIAYFEENEEIFNACIEELDNYNGCLGEDRRLNMDELDEILSGYTATELLNRAFYGWDDDNWTEDRFGRKEHAQFNPNRDYFYFNAYGNLVSTNYIDYSDFLCESTIVVIVEEWDNLGIDAEPELCDLITALVEAIEAE